MNVAKGAKKLAIGDPLDKNTRLGALVSKQQRETVESLGGRTGSEPLPVGLVVAAVYRPGGPTELRPLTPAHAVLQLLNGTVVRALALSQSRQARKAIP